MGDAADDAYDRAERQQSEFELMVNNIRKDCQVSILGYRPCYIVPNNDDRELPYRCQACGKEFDL